MKKESLIMKKYLFLLFLPCLLYSMQLSEKEKNLFYNLPILKKFDVVMYIPGFLPKIKYIFGAQVEVPDLSTDQNFWNPIHFAAYSGDTTLVPLFKKLGAKIDKKDGNGLTPIMLAAFHFNDLNTVLELAGHGADLDIADNKGNALIHRAIKEGHPDVFHLLLEFKSEGQKLDLKKQDKQGKTPLALAQQFNLPQDLIRKLKELTSQPGQA